MSINTINVTLRDATETDLFNVTSDNTTEVQNVYINTNDDAGSTNGFHTVNSGGDTLTLQWKRKDQAGNFQIVDETVVDQGQTKKMISLSDQSVSERDWKVTGNLSTDNGDVRITGSYVTDEVVEDLNDFDPAADTVNADQIEGVDATDQIRDSIVDDATRFSGANIDQAISDNATPTEVKTQADQALVDIDLDHLISASVSDSDVTDDSIIAQFVSASATANYSDFDNTTDSLQNIFDSIDGLNDPTKEAIRDAILNRDTVNNHNTADTVGRLLEILGAGIQDRSNNSTLESLLGVPDASGATLSVTVDNGSVNETSATTTEFETDITGQNDGFYDNMIIKFIGGSNDGQVRDVTQYQSSNGTFTIGKSLDSAPSNGDNFVVMGLSSTITRD